MVECEGRSVRIFWNRDMIYYLRRHYATTKNQELGECLGVSIRTITRKARELGLKKENGWMVGVQRENIKIAQIVHRRMGYPGSFQPGYKPKISFGNGTVLTAEQMERRRKSIRRYYLTHPDAASKRMRKSWVTRKRRKEEGNDKEREKGVSEEN